MREREAAERATQEAAALEATEFDDDDDDDDHKKKKRHKHKHKDKDD